MFSCSSIIFLTCINVCKDKVDVLEFYAEENPLQLNGVTKLHIVLDKIYGPIKVIILPHNYSGLMPNYPDSDEAFDRVFLGGEDEKQSSHYTIYFRAPPDPGRDIFLYIYEDDEDQVECYDAKLIIITFE